MENKFNEELEVLRVQRDAAQQREAILLFRLTEISKRITSLIEEFTRGR